MLENNITVNFFYVRVSIGSVLKPFTAYIAKVRFQPTVHIHVSFKDNLIVESFRAYSTLVLSLGEVHVDGLHVHFQAVLYVECFVTLIAPEAWSAVLGEVELERALQHQHLLETDGTTVMLPPLSPPLTLQLHLPPLPFPNPVTVFLRRLSFFPFEILS